MKGKKTITEVYFLIPAISGKIQKSRPYRASEKNPDLIFPDLIQTTFYTKVRIEKKSRLRRATMTVAPLVADLYLRKHFYDTGVRIWEL